MEFLKDNKGIAMPTVLVLVAVILLLGITIVAVINFDAKTVNNLGSTEDALQIAEAGYNKYLWLLNDDTYFYKEGENKELGFEIESTYTASENAKWAGYTKTYKKAEYKVGNDLLGYYQITITPPTIGNPAVGVRSTGWTRDEKSQRTIYVEIHKRGFQNYVELTNSDPPKNKDIGWEDGEVINGPYFTNASLWINGDAEFNSTVGYVNELEVKNGANPEYNGGAPVKHDQGLAFPALNTELTKWADDEYKFKGRTCIYLDKKKVRILYLENGDTSKVRYKETALPESGVIYVNGTLFISGVLDGRLTVFGEEEIYITSKDPTDDDYNYGNADIPKSGAKSGGLLYADQNIPQSKTDDYTCNDMLGLISNKDIIISTHYWPCKFTFLTPNGYYWWFGRCEKNINVQAAILTTGEGSSFRVQDYNFLFDKGKLFFHGSRATEGVGASFMPYVLFSSWEWNSGFRENLSYDFRLSFDAPPHFLEPANSGWEVVTWKEVANTAP